ncbi:MAG: glutamate--tRNA ligase [Candidatus Zixiibacteriota bacterium]|nr:MAG: glutamate--tRNA ligase [candidate division Zixibacteria bacterium]
MSDVVVRFAPSPTGYLHVGGARTALFNWLYARHHGGRFLLRIEDTDRRRSTPEATAAIFEGLRWLGLDWEGEPLFQSSRLEEHRKLVQVLLDRNAVYRCFCDPETLARDQQSAEKGGGSWGYPGTCRNLSEADIRARREAGAPFAVRFRTPEGETVFRDGVHGEVRTPNRDISDFILLRRDGTPVYNVAVVSDDAFMGVTHVIRGDDHISNTPKQILIYQAAGLPVPQFSHVPLILGPDKKRLSKRHGATSVTEYRDRGLLPETMRNFLVLLGWSPGDDREIMSLEELTAAFDVSGINPSGAVFDEAKLDWMNGRYIAARTDAEVWEGIKPYLAAWALQEGLQIPSEEEGVKLAGLFRERLRRWTEAPEKLEYFLRDPSTFDEKGRRKHWTEATPGQMRRLAEELEALDDWSPAGLEAAFDRVAGDLGLKRADLIHPARLALTGRTATPGMFEVMERLGRDTSLRRLRRGTP